MAGGASTHGGAAEAECLEAAEVAEEVRPVASALVRAVLAAAEDASGAEHLEGAAVVALRAGRLEEAHALGRRAAREGSLLGAAVAVDAAARRADADEAREAAAALVAAAEEAPGEGAGLRGGRAGALHALLAARRTAGGEAAVGVAALRNLAVPLLDEGLNNADATPELKCGLRYAAGGSDDCLGLFEGAAGVGLALLQLEKVAGDLPCAREVRDCLGALGMGLTQEGLVPVRRAAAADGHAPATLREGAPGVALALCAACAHSGSSVGPARVYVPGMKRAATGSWVAALSAGTGEGLGLADGAPGVGYAFLALWNAVGERSYLDRALHVAKRVAEEASARGAGEAPGCCSLLTGAAGAAVYLMDVLNPEAAACPGFELPLAPDAPPSLGEEVGEAPAA